MPNRSALHTQTVKAVRLELGTEPDLVLWPVQPGGVPDSTGRPIHTGPAGMADLVGVLAPRGRWFCLEVKTGKARQSAAQRRWERLIARHGGFYAVVRASTPSAIPSARAFARDCLEAARRGATTYPQRLRRVA